MMDGRAINVTKMIKSSRSTLTEETFLTEAGSEQFRDLCESVSNDSGKSVSFPRRRWLGGGDAMKARKEKTYPENRTKQ
jgi:hypothetical protein